MVRYFLFLLVFLVPCISYAKRKNKKKKRNDTTFVLPADSIVSSNIILTDTLVDSIAVQMGPDTLGTDSLREEKDIVQIEDTTKKVEFVKKDTVSIIGVGDIMLGTSYPTEPNYLPPNNNCFPLLADVTDILVDADLTFGNLEGALTDSHESAKKCKDPKTCYAFSMPTKYIDCIKQNGFDVLSIANNHSGDFDYQGRKSTMHILDSVGIEFAGLFIKDRAVFVKDSIKYGFCAFAPNQGTTSLLDIPKAKEIVSSLDSICDIVIVSFHGGAEGSKYEHTPRQREIFLGLNRGEVYKFAHDVIDAGADVVFGHGPHVTRAMDLYKNRFIIYSMGNFCTYKRFNLSGPNGMAPIVKIYTTNNGEFLHGQIFPVVQYDGIGTKKDPYNRVIKRLQELTKEDFPEAPLIIKDSGEVQKKVD